MGFGCAHFYGHLETNGETDGGVGVKIIITHNNNNVKQAKKRITPVIYDPSIYVKTRPNHFSVFIQSVGMNKKKN